MSKTEKPGASDGKPAAESPDVHGTYDTETDSWYLAEAGDGEPSGPHPRAELLKRIAAGTLRVDAYAWSEELGEMRWRRICEINHFEAALQAFPRVPLPKRFSRGLAAAARGVGPGDTPTLSFENKEGEYGEQNLYRRYPRAPFEAEVILHNQHRYWRGTSIDISEKGLYLNTDEPHPFAKGDEVVVTVRNGPGATGTFSVTGVVIRLLGQNKNEGIGIFFLRLNPQARRKIVRYVLQALRSDAGRGASPEGAEEKQAA